MSDRKDSFTRRKQSRGRLLNAQVRAHSVDAGDLDGVGDREFLEGNIAAIVAPLVVEFAEEDALLEDDIPTRVGVVATSTPRWR